MRKSSTACARLKKNIPTWKRAAAKELDATIASWGACEDELMGEYKEIRQAFREKKRNAK